MPYQVPHPFKTITKQRSIFLDALECAKEAFLKEGALLPVQFDVEDVKVQEYPDEHAVVFIVRRWVNARELFVVRKYDLTPNVVAWLKATGRWEDGNLN